MTPPDTKITCNIRSNTTNGKYLWWDIADVDVGPELWEVMCMMCQYHTLCEGWYIHLYIDANYALFTTCPPVIIKSYNISEWHTGSLGRWRDVAFISEALMMAGWRRHGKTSLSAVIVNMEKTTRRTAANNVSFYR